MQTYQENFDEHQDNKELMARKLLFFRYYDDGYNEMFGTKYCMKKCIDPVTDMIMKVGDVTNDDEVREMARDVFGYEIQNEVSVFKNNLLG